MLQRLAIAGLFAVGTLIVAPPQVQTPAPQSSRPGTALIIGKTVDEAGRSLAGVIVTLAAAGGARQLVMVDRNGGFVFSNLAAGNYQLTAQKPGYADGGADCYAPPCAVLSFPLNDGDKLLDAELRLWKFGVITGTVTDEAGEAVVNVSVRLLRESRVGGRASWLLAGAAGPDDRGVYRFSSLNAGEYVVVIPSKETTLPAAFMDDYLRGTASPDVENALRTVASLGMPGQGDEQRFGRLILLSSINAPIRPDPKDDGTFAVYPLAMYPGLDRSASADRLTLRAGEERSGVDLQLRPTRAFRITGALAGPDGPSIATQLTLIPQAVDAARLTGLESAATVTDGSGAFTLAGVPPGQYVLRARLPAAPPPFRIGPAPPAAAAPSDPDMFWVAEPVTVGNADASLNVAFRRGARISGRFQFAGTATPPSEQEFRQWPIYVSRVDGVTEAFGRANPDGTYRTPGVQPGQYLVYAPSSSTTWHFKSAIVEGRDRSLTPLDVRSDDVSNVVITFTDSHTQLAGSVMLQGAPDRAAAVVLFPADPAVWRDVAGYRRMWSTRTSRTGGYVFSDRVPGDYLVVAIPAAAIARDWMDPAFLQVLARSAVRVQIADGQNVAQNLQTTVVR